MEKRQNLPQFEPTEQNVMSIINLVKLYEKTTNKSEKQIVEKYTKHKCSDLASLIKIFMPDSRLVLSLVLEEDGFTHSAYHYFAKLPDPQNPNEYHYYDINGKHSKEGLKEYVTKILGHEPTANIGFTDNDIIQHRRLSNDNQIIIKCAFDIAHQPNLITNGILNKGK